GILILLLQSRPIDRPAVIRTRRPGPRELVHDTVLWQDDGRRWAGGGVIVDGPFCPVDRSTLLYLGFPSGQPTPIEHHHDIGGDKKLICPECRVTFGLTSNNSPKSVELSRKQ